MALKDLKNKVLCIDLNGEKFPFHKDLGIIHSDVWWVRASLLHPKYVSKFRARSVAFAIAAVD